MALLVALVIDQLVTHSNDAAGRWILMFGLAGVAAALLPVVPTPFAAVSRAPVPQFISAKMYKAYVPAGQSILFLPVPMGTVGATASEWTSTPGADFASVGGYFLAPDMRTPEGEAMFGPTPRHTSSLFENLILRNQVPVIGPQDRKEAVADLKFWHTAIVVLAPNEKPNTQLRKIMDDLIGFEPQWVGGVWLWDVRSLVKSG
jgi:dolichyl-phosphate beta-glucosyltransferase